MLRQTKVGVWEEDLDPRWLSPYHVVHYEVETKDGPKMKTMPGLRRSSKIISFRNKKEELPEFLK